MHARTHVHAGSIAEDGRQISYQYHSTPRTQMACVINIRVSM